MSGLALTVRLARALLPSWRFFDTVEPAPGLSIRVGLADTPLGDWCSVALVRPARSARALFNPDENLALAQHALLEQLLGDVADAAVTRSEHVEELTSYRLVRRLARAHACAALPVQAGASFQFKVVLPQPSGLDEDVLVSRVLAL